ncbi:[FeFe] hydrogenase H-cluster maturation GTPase HydF [Clostridium tyrobutyricum]|jgi:[FeFe] hydrogenase H-cluster maturation GTPase HydF|uniref:[FeFe] hydrogenase H-cluster maturation GTPase HydF n=1 Tax=Clostridium tyrobutyricum TaxID=1519 RepID=UPI0010AA2084|nr:[FeFe] hydrogenase H-cluster maturation GTPase HydF [Clostridium tyrobutyricum]MBV4429279.1 [FeFe] hydrogenase H-cluster maturation GTPase HydF [Clostridium tyrobutyricum]MBV4444451.1 [FeFe] hydrogenase H-cluster maturation GTPase HydF [Clostridium tyrobutyricum]MCH4201230.1 [FeFe] hydrogenase H-cluster maturation GTPase HydF [Clostridium tyrobutyricum]MCH4236693.1 [FeFe] hydrogenase H-cluster maturation GTPase HydF [Clostridium tyrobutyricum]MCH4259765.1 [FeFe] hydrogenase H-cluster matura
MQDTPKANRLHIALFGRRNAGKSSLINSITGQDIALVSEFLGTTTDPVYKAMELPPIGPVVIIDTAGLDDTGTLGELRIKKTKEVMDKTDLAILVFTQENLDLTLEKNWYSKLKECKIPTIGVLNKIDNDRIDIDETLKLLKKQFPIPFIKVSAKMNKNIGTLKEAIQVTAPTDFEKETIVGDILSPKSKVILVAPQDLEAPKGRLILPQVQVIRDVLDHDCLALTVKDSELSDMLACLKDDPDLVITDSQVFGKVNKILPEHIPLTSFSILMARYKGDLKILVNGAKAIDKLKPGDKVLIAEACTHHALKNDIGRDKIPRWLKNKVGGNLDVTVKAGVDFPEDLTPYNIIIHCGSCMFNRKQFITRLIRAQSQNIPITNYGITIAYLNGILDKVTNMFFQ